MNQAVQGKDPPEFLSTHPSGETRIEQLTELMPSVEPLYREAQKK
jgi:predicted Zn-dependent protease